LFVGGPLVKVGKAVAGTVLDALGPYEVGLFNELTARSVVGDALDIHHVVQGKPASQIIDGYIYGKAPSIALPSAEHRLIPNLTGEFSGTARDLLARDIVNLRNFTNAPNSALQDLIELNKTTYPNAFAK
jgi:hypothetical protein